ncbi:MAG: vitamin B12 transporter [Psychrobacter glaciei]|jgi:vitamin B12 transporter
MPNHWLVSVKSRSLLHTILTLSLFLLSGYSVSENNKSEVETKQETELESVEISGKQIKSYSTYDFIGSHQSIEAEQFNQSFNTLPSILEQQSGIEIQSIGGIGQYSSPVIRGSTGQQVLVFWDGMLINNISGGSADIGSMSLNLANSIDIYRSVAPAELSASAVGGVINIKSKDITESSKNNDGEATIAVGSYGAQQLSISQSFNIGSSRWLMATDYLTADNDFKYVQIGSVINPNTPTVVPRYNNGSEQYSVLLKGQQAYKTSTFDLAFQTSQNHRELSSKINSPSNEAKLSTQNNNVQLRWSYFWNPVHKSELLTALITKTQLYNDKNSTIGLGAQLNEYSTYGQQIQLNHYIELEKVTALLSTRLQNEETKTDYQLLTEDELLQQCNAGRGCETAYKRLQQDLSGRLQYQTNDNQLTLQASQIKLRDKNLTTSNSNNQFSGNTWSIGFDHQFKHGLTNFINFANQVRLPSTSELFGDRGMSIGNPDLQPETSEQFEIGLTYQNDTFDIKSSLYLRNVEQAIVGESDSRGVIRYSNLSTTQHIGMEQNIIWKPIHPLSITANLTIQSNEIIKDERFSYYEGKQVAGYSQFYSYISAQWVKTHWDIKLSNTLEREGFYVNSNLLPKDDKNRWDLSLGTNINQWRISLDVNDITNNSAQDYPYYPEPGRTYFLRANTKW